MQRELSTIRRIELWCAGALTGVIVFLQVYRASQAGALWRDEIATLGVATMPSLSQLWAALPHECCAVLPYIGLRLWTSISWLGDGDASLRVLPALIGIGIFLVLWCNRKALGYNVPVFSLVLFGLNPTVIRWLSSIRGYGLGILFLLLACALIWNVVKSPFRGRVAAAALVSVLSVQCLYQNTLFLLAICLGASFVCIRKRRWQRMLVVLGIGAVSALSLIPYLPTIRKAQEVLVVAQASYPWSFLLDRLRWAVSVDVPFLLWTWVICTGLGLLIAGYLAVYKWQDPVQEDAADLCLFSLTVMVISTVLFLGFLKTTNLPTNPWYFVIWMGVIAMSLDVGLEQAANTFRGRMARLVAAGIIAGVTIPITWAVVPERFTNLDLIASAMEEHASDEDLIVFNPYWYGITFQRYYHGRTKWITVPPIEDLQINRFDLAKARMTSVDPLRTVWDDIEKSLRSGNRVWVIGQLHVPPVGQLPYVFPPAPNGPEGWRLDAYLGSWSVQLGYFLSSHLIEGREVPMEIMQEIRFTPGVETPVVQAGTGWH